METCFLRRIMLCIMLTALLCTSAPVQAAEQTRVVIPVTVELEGEVEDASDETFEIVLNAQDPAAPMPQGSIHGVYRTQVVGQYQGSLPEICYDRVGVYSYSLFQLKGSNPLCNYDATVYSLTVTVVWNDETDALEAMVKLTPEDNGRKLNGAVFINFMNLPPVPSNPTTPSDPTTPSSPTRPKDPNHPETGDNFRPGLYITLAASSAVALVLLLRKSKKTED